MGRRARHSRRSRSIADRQERRCQRRSTPLAGHQPGCHDPRGSSQGRAMRPGPRSGRAVLRHPDGLEPTPGGRTSRLPDRYPTYHARVEQPRGDQRPHHHAPWPMDTTLTLAAAHHQRPRQPARSQNATSDPRRIRPIGWPAFGPLWRSPSYRKIVLYGFRVGAGPAGRRGASGLPVDSSPAPGSSQPGSLPAPSPRRYPAGRRSGSPRPPPGPATGLGA